MGHNPGVFFSALQGLKDFQVSLYEQALSLASVIDLIVSDSLTLIDDISPEDNVNREDESMNSPLPRLLRPQFGGWGMLGHTKQLYESRCLYTGIAAFIVTLFAFLCLSLVVMRRRNSRSGINKMTSEPFSSKITRHSPPKTIRSRGLTLAQMHVAHLEVPSRAVNEEKVQSLPVIDATAEVKEDRQPSTNNSTRRSVAICGGRTVAFCETKTGTLHTCEVKKEYSSISPKKKRGANLRKKKLKTLSPQRAKTKPGSCSTATGTRWNGSLSQQRILEIQAKHESSHPLVNADKSRNSRAASVSAFGVNSDSRATAPKSTKNSAKPCHSVKVSQVENATKEFLTNKRRSPRKGKSIITRVSCDKYFINLPTYTSSKDRILSVLEEKKFKRKKESPHKLEKLLSSSTRKSSKSRLAPKKVSDGKKRTRCKNKGKSRKTVRSLSSSIVCSGKKSDGVNIICPVTLQPCNTFISNLSDSTVESFIDLRKTKPPELSSLKGEGAFRSYIKETSASDSSLRMKNNIGNLQIQDSNSMFRGCYQCMELYRGSTGRGKVLFGKIRSQHFPNAHLQKEKSNCTEIAFSNQEYSIGDAKSNTGRHNKTFLEQKARSFSNDNSKTLNSSIWSKDPNTCEYPYDVGKQMSSTPKNLRVHVRNRRNPSISKRVVFERDKTKIRGDDNKDVTPLFLIDDGVCDSSLDDQVESKHTANKKDKDNLKSRLLPVTLNLSDSFNYEERRMNPKDDAVSSITHSRSPQKCSEMTKNRECHLNSSKQHIFKRLCLEHQDAKRKGFDLSHEISRKCQGPHAKHDKSDGKPSHLVQVDCSSWCQDSHLGDDITEVSLKPSKTCCRDKNGNGPTELSQKPDQEHGLSKVLMTGQKKGNFVSLFKSLVPKNKSIPVLKKTAKLSNSPVAAVQVVNDGAESGGNQNESKLKCNQPNRVFRVKQNKITTLYSFRPTQRCQVKKIFNTRKELLMRTSRLHNMLHKTSMELRNKETERDRNNENLARNVNYDNSLKQHKASIMKPLPKTTDECRKIKNAEKENNQLMLDNKFNEKFTDSFRVVSCNASHKCQMNHHSPRCSLQKDVKPQREIKDKLSTCLLDTCLKAPHASGDFRRCAYDKRHSMDVKRNDSKDIFSVRKNSTSEEIKNNFTPENRNSYYFEKSDKGTLDKKSAHIHHHTSSGEHSVQVSVHNPRMKCDRRQHFEVTAGKKNSRSNCAITLAGHESNRASSRLGVKLPRDHHVCLTREDKYGYPTRHNDVNEKLAKDQINNIKIKRHQRHEESIDTIRADMTEKKQQKLHNQLTKKSKSIISVRQMLSELTSNSKIKSQTKYHMQEEKIPYSKVCKVIYVKPANRPFKHLRPKQERQLPPQPEPIYFHIPKDVAICNTLNTSEEHIGKSDYIKYYKLRKVKSHRHQPYRRQNSLTSNMSTSSPSGDHCRYHTRNKNNCSPCRRRQRGLKSLRGQTSCTDISATEVKITSQNVEGFSNCNRSSQRMPYANIAQGGELGAGGTYRHRGSQGTSPKRHTSVDMPRASRARSGKSYERPSDKSGNGCTSGLNSAQMSDVFYNSVRQGKIDEMKKLSKSSVDESENSKNINRLLIAGSSNDLKVKSDDIIPAKALYNQDSSDLKVLRQDKHTRFNIAQHKLSLLKKRLLCSQNRETMKLSSANKLLRRSDMKCKHSAIPTFRNKAFQSFGKEQKIQFGSENKSSSPAIISHMTQTEDLFNAVSIGVQTSPRLSFRPRNTSFLYRRKICPMMPKLLKEKDLIVRERSMRHKKLLRASENQIQLHVENTFFNSDPPIKIKKDVELNQGQTTALNLCIPESQESNTYAVAQNSPSKLVPTLNKKEYVKHSAPCIHAEGQTNHFTDKQPGDFGKFLFEHTNQVTDVDLDPIKELVDQTMIHDENDICVGNKIKGEVGKEIRKCTSEQLEFNTPKSRDLSDGLLKPPEEMTKNEQAHELATSLQSDISFINRFTAPQDTSTSETASRQTGHRGESVTSFTSSKLSELRKMCLIRPKWKEANIDEIDRRVKRALRLREELQKSRSPSGQRSRSVIFNFALSDGDSQTENKASNSEKTGYQFSDLNEAASSGTAGYKTKPNLETTVQSGNTVSTSEYASSFNVSNNILLNKKPANTSQHRHNRHLETPNIGASAGLRNRAYDIEEQVSRKPRLERSVSFHEQPVCEIKNRPERPSSAHTSSRPSQSNSCSNSMKRARIRDKNSPPTKMSKVENAPAKLAGELVQSLPQVPLSSFVEWFIETSDPNNYITSEKSSSSSDKNVDTEPSQLAESTLDKANRLLVLNGTGKLHKITKLKQQPMTFTLMSKTSSSIENTIPNRNVRGQNTPEEESEHQASSMFENPVLDKPLHAKRRTKYTEDCVDPGDQTSNRDQTSDRKGTSCSLFQKKTRLKDRDHSLHTERETLKTHAGKVRKEMSILATAATDYSVTDVFDLTEYTQERERSLREPCTSQTQLEAYSRPDTASSEETKTEELTDCAKWTQNVKTDDNQTTVTPPLDRTWTVTSKEEDEQSDLENNKCGTASTNLFRDIRHSLNMTVRENPLHQQDFVDKSGQEQFDRGQQIPDRRRDDHKDKQDKYAPGIRHILMKLRHHNDKDNESEVCTTETTTKAPLTTMTTTRATATTSRPEKMRITLRKSSDVTGIVAKFQTEKTQ